MALALLHPLSPRVFLAQSASPQANTTSNQPKVDKAPQAMHILIADDHSIIRSGLRHLLSDLGDDAQFSEAATFSQLQAAIHDEKPSLLILDLFMPGLGNMGDIATLARQISPAPIVVLSRSEAVDDMRAVLQAGARAFIPKSTDERQILGILRLVLEGGTYIPPQLAGLPHEALAPAVDREPLATAAASTAAGAGGRDDPRVQQLTERQREVLRLMADGLSNAEIAERMNLTLSTVKGHGSEILKTLAVSNRTQAVLIYRGLA